MIKKSFSFIQLLLVCLCALHTINGVADTPKIDAGSLLNLNEQELKNAKPLALPPVPTSAPSPVTEDGGATVEVRKFEFAGNKLIGSAQLSEALVHYANQTLTLAQLKDASNRVINVYRLAGWTAHAFLPKQEIADGVVLIQIVEAVFGKVVIQGDEAERIHKQRLLGMVESAVPKGHPIQSSNVDRALLLMDDLPGVSVLGNLIPGDQEGETNLVISAKDDPLVTGTVVIDNQGSQSTGTGRLGLNLNVNSPSRMGDMLSLNALKTEGSEYLRLAYSLPIGYSGWRAGLHASNMNYEVISGSISSIKANGTATTSGWDISYPLLRSQLSNINWTASYDYKQFENNPSNLIYSINVYSSALSATQIDSWAGGGMNSQTMSVTSGRTSKDGRYSKLNLNASRLQSLTAEWSVLATGGAQFTQNNLDSSEKLYLGGATGVRGYPSGEAGGSEGNTFSLELKRRINNELTLGAFYDYGRVKVNHDNNLSSPANPNSYDLQAYGFALDWQFKPTVDLKTTVSRRIGSNPLAVNYNGNDSDGTLKQTRLWVSVTVAF
jgi:hemolysin activation/secretion protein